MQESLSEGRRGSGAEKTDGGQASLRPQPDRCPCTVSPSTQGATAGNTGLQQARALRATQPHRPHNGERALPDSVTGGSQSHPPPLQRICISFHRFNKERLSPGTESQVLSKTLSLSPLMAKWSRFNPSLPSKTDWKVSNSAQLSGINLRSVCLSVCPAQVPAPLCGLKTGTTQLAHPVR